MRIYYGFTDPSGGSSDSMVLAISHWSRMLGKAVCDGFWEKRAPFNPDEVTREFAEILASYRITVVVGDRYAGEWPRERFRSYSIKYEVSERTKGQIYQEFIVLLNSGKVRMPRDRRVRAQFESLERRVSRSGKDVIDHPPSGHDDLANAICGALLLAASASSAPRQAFMPRILSISRDGKGTWSDQRHLDEGGPRWWKPLN